MFRSAKLLTILAIVCAAFVFTARASDQDVDVCSLVQANLNRHANKMVASYQAEEYVQSFVETLKMKEVHNLWAEYSCGPSTPSNLSSSSLAQFTSIQHLTEISREAIASISNTISQDYSYLMEHINALAQKGLDKSIQLLIGSKQNSQSNEWSCIICGMLVKLAQNDASFKKQNIANYLSNEFCKLFPSSLHGTCESFIQTIGPYLIEAQLKHHNADVICAKSGACAGKYLQCHIDGQSNPSPTSPNPAFEYMLSASKFNSPWNWVIELVKSFADDHLPVVDLDNDGFSTIPTLRGYNWRGKDCNDFVSSVHPGVKHFTGKDQTIDYNCNGISGVDTVSGKTYEQLLCEGTEQYGIITMGDSAGAHFEIPPAYLNVTLWSEKPFHDILTVLSNEFDLPMKSGTTGYEFDAPHMNSLHKYLVELNRCNRNDYQNLGVNGAMSTDSLHNIQAIRRNQTHDHPVFMVFELIGNDVCDPAHSFNAMTKPELFREKILELWNYLDSVIPAGSHMIIWGVADGRILYNTLKEKLEPIGMTYPDFYDYLNCLGVSPCWGYMNTDEVIRNETAAWADSLNDVYKSILADPTIKFNNFDQVYYDLPIEEIIDMAIVNGYTAQDIIEPVDGFHPSQLANEYLAEVFWSNIQRDRPQWIPRENPNNAKIDSLFGGSNFIRQAKPVSQ